MTAVPTVGARYLLTHLLHVVPEFTIVEPFRDRNLGIWRTQGSHSLISSSSKSFFLAVNHREYAATLIAEIEHLLNHANEHRAHLLNAQSSAREASPSWLFVSLYYFSLFIAMAWTRATNGAILYLDKEAIREYCGSVTPTPGGGAYKASLKINASTGAAELEMKKCGVSHFHEAVWIEVCAEAASAVKWIESFSAARKPTADEMLSLRGLRLFGGVGFDDPIVWPSKLRNAINYRPGFSYRTIVSNNFLRIRSRLGQAPFVSMESLLDYGERAKLAVKGVRNPLDVANDAVDLLIAESLVLEVFIEDCLANLSAIRDIGSSAPKLRQRFNRTHCASNSILSRVKP